MFSPRLTRLVLLSLIAVSAAGAIRDYLLAGLVAFAVVGAVIVWHRPGNTIGWLLTLIGAFPAASDLVPPGDGAVAALNRVVGQLNSAAFGLLVFVVLLFPSGHLPSARWRWPARVAATAIGSIAAMGILRADGGGANNPLRISALQPVVDALFGPTAAVLAFLGVAALINAFVRMRRATGDERKQMRWFATSAMVFPILMVARPTGGPLEVWFFFGTFTVGLAALAVGIGVAVLKYRLYAIDVVINKTLVFGALAAFIAAIYVGVVVGVGQVVSSSGEPNIVLSLVATTLVAVTFHAVRERLQTFANRLVYGQRLSPYEAVASFAHRVAGSLSFDHVLPEMAEAAALGVGAARSRVRLLLPSGAEELACWPPGGQVGDSFDRVIPVAHHGETVGEIAITKPRGEQVSKQDETLLRDLASEAGMAMSSLRLTDELKQRLVDLQESRRRIVSAHDEERRRMERDLHDGAQQQLVGIKIKLGLVKALLPDPPEGVGELLEGIVQDTSATVGTLRDLARGLFPEVLVQRGLVAAVDAHVEKSGLDAEVASDPSVGRYDIEVESNVYFIVREALQNTSKYAPGAHSTITLGETGDGLVFVVSDDGPGFDATTVTLGSGTQNMRDRVEVLGGVLEVTSTPGAGTTVRGTIPLRTAIAGVVDARSDADTQEQTIDLNRTRTAAAT